MVQISNSTNEPSTTAIQRSAVIVRFTEEDRQKLRFISLVEEISMAEIVRRSVEAYVAQNFDSAVKKAQAQIIELSEADCEAVVNEL